MFQKTEIRRPPRLAQCAGLLALALLLAWIAHIALSPLLLGRRAWPDSVVDYRILYERSRYVVENKQYGADIIFPYPPCAVAMFWVTALPPYRVAAGLWLSITLVATVVTLVLGLSLVDLSSHPWRWPAALAAFVLADFPIQWDLRSQNCNMVCCCLLTAALVALKSRRSTLTGILLSASIALKLYPVLVLPYLWLTGERRAFAASLCFVAAFFVILPLAAFGVDNVISIHVSWIDQLRSIAATINESNHPILIALPFTLTKHLGAGSSLIPWLTGAAAALWLVAVATCVLAGRPWQSGARPDGFNLAVDGGFLTLAPILISPYLEPYHALPALLPILALVQRTIDPSPAVRATGLGSLALAFGWMTVKLSGVVDYRGFGVLAQMVLIALALAAIRWRAKPPTVDRTACRAAQDRHELYAMNVNCAAVD